MDTHDGADGESVMERPLTEAERKENVLDLLREEMEMHLKEGRASVQRNKERVERISKLKEELRQETEKQREALQDPNQSGPDNRTVAPGSHAEYSTLLEQRRKLKEDHERVIQEELLKMETELQEEPVAGLEGEVVYLNRERWILVLQVEALCRESQQAEAGLEAQHKLHQQEMNRLREESLQVFRMYRHVLEQQKQVSEGRYRSLLLETIQDAVHLSTQNQQLTADNKQLRKALAELKAQYEPVHAQDEPIQAQYDHIKRKE
ncbi:uncharacterized protein LOC143514546 [Brachyhypopomus gauderio]|uniref:uncharacterized protein LOC143514546 n=1 Tax=Brachyhypopomus gauderio TaxID=698409 RepID=UPI004042DFB9